MDTNISKVKFIGEKDLFAEIASQRLQLDFSETKIGPDCDGCFSISFNTDCGHPFVYRKRCNVGDLVCAGSDILSVHLRDIVLRRKGCRECRSLKRVDNHRYKDQTLKRKRGQCAHSPEQMAAKMRLEEGRERWKRQCLKLEGRGLSLGSANSQALLQRKAVHVEVIDLTGEDSE